MVKNINMINWRIIKDVGLPKDPNIGYLVTDGKNFDYSDIEIIKYPEPGVKWLGGNVYALYEEVSGTEFDFYPIAWCPVTELNLPKL